MTIDGGRVWTRWYPNRASAAAAKKLLRAPAIQTAVVTDSRTVGEAIASWLRGAKIASSTRGGYEVSARNYLSELALKQAAKLSRTNVVDHFAVLAERGLSHSTIHQAANVLKKALDHAIENEWDGISANAAMNVRIPFAPTEKVEGFDPGERIKVLSAIAGHRFEARYRLGLIWMLRPGEATGLTWDRVDLDRKTVVVTGQLQRSKILVDGSALGTVYRKVPKSHAGGRRLSIDEETVRLLKVWKDVQRDERSDTSSTGNQERKQTAQSRRLKRAKALNLLYEPELYATPPNNLVFTLPNGDPMLPRLDADRWKAILLAAGVNHRRLYSARHTAVNHLLVTGAPLLNVSVAAGHSNQAFTQRVYGGVLDALTEGLAELINVERDSQIPIEILRSSTSSDMERQHEGVTDKELP